MVRKKAVLPAGVHAAILLVLELCGCSYAAFLPLKAVNTYITGTSIPNYPVKLLSNLLDFD